MRAMAFLSGPFFILNGILIVVNLTLAVINLFKLLSRKSSEKLAGMDRGINCILLICFIMIFFTYMDPIFGLIRANFSIASAGTGDPRVILSGIVKFLLPMNINLAFCSFFLIVWFLLRAYHRLILEQAEKSTKNI